MHFPVLLNEVLEYLVIRPDGVYWDATAGLGGHVRAIAEKLGGGTVFASDRDGESIEIARSNIAGFEDRVRFRQARFSELKTAFAAAGVEKVDGLLADLGVSRFQLTDPERGFSWMSEGPLDMRMDRSEGEKAFDLVNFASETELSGVIFQLGEERRSRRIARAIVRSRPVHTTAELARVVERAAPRTSRLHPATLTFMALRMAVNRELEELDSFLEQAPGLVKPGGRIVVISFHSLEDRKVKRSFQALARAGRINVLTKHVRTPTEAEIHANPPSRSAKLRAVEVTSAN